MSDRKSALKYESCFKDKVCLVTGATSGIGKSVALKLLMAGIAYINLRCCRNNDCQNNSKTQRSNSRV